MSKGNGNAHRCVFITLGTSHSQICKYQKYLIILGTGHSLFPDARPKSDTKPEFAEKPGERKFDA